MHAFLFVLLMLPQETASGATVAVSGGIEFDYLYRSSALNEASHWVPGGLAVGSPLNDGDTRIVPKILLDLDAVVGEHWSANLRLANRRIVFDTFSVPDQTRSAEEIDLFIERAWLRGAAAGLEVTLGAQDFALSSVFLDLGRAESPWGELPDATMPPFPPAGTSRVPQTRRDELQPVGAVVRAKPAGIDATLFLFPSLRESGEASVDEAVHGLHLGVPLWESGPRLEAVAAIFAGGTDLDGSGTGHQRIVTLGAGGSWRLDSLEVGVEGYLQSGDAGRISTGELDAGGRAFRVRAKVGGKSLWIEAGYLHLSGDSDGLDGEENRFLSYENNDEFLVAESNEFGLDLDNNLRSWRLAAGGTLFEDALSVTARVGGFRFDHAPDPLPGTKDPGDDLGTEADLSLRLAVSSQLVFRADAGWLFRASALEGFTRIGKDGAAAGTVGIQLRF